MFQKIWSGLTTATFLVVALGVNTPGEANQAVEVDDELPAKVSQTQVQPEAQPGLSVSALDPAALPQQETAPAYYPETSSEAATPVATASEAADEVSKVGEYQTESAEDESEAAIATLRSHTLNGLSAATIYVRSIPVLTVLGSALSPSAVSTVPTPSQTSEGFQQTGYAQSTATGNTEAKLPTASQEESLVAPANKESAANSKLAGSQSSEIWRAAAIAARINEVNRDGVDASTITVRWDEQRQRYLIQVGEEELLLLTPDTRLPDTTSNPAQDALQVTNRLRRLLGNAAPLTEIVGAPQSSMQISLGPIQLRLSGIASWYGPGFHGNRSANGERFDQNALTAAHRTLPFGTQVRVTNTRNGRSVVVRINDRGPYSGGRVIDLSAAAARAVGMIGTGVAPVTLEVMSNRTAYQP